MTASARRATFALGLLLLAGCAPGGDAVAPPAAPSIPQTSRAAATAVPSESSLPTPAPSTSAAATPSTPAGPPAPTGSTKQPAGPPAAGRRTATINYSGDLLWHNTLWRSAALDAGRKGEMDFFPQLAGLRDYVSRADLAICHSEVPFAPEGGPYESYPIFAAPPAIAPALKQVGWDLCTTASNHSVDKGFKGLERTIAVHRKVGILTSGTYASEQARNTPVIFTTTSGVKVAVVSSTFGTNGIPLPSGKEWSVSLMDHDDVLGQAKRARRAGADIVVVHMHAGTEYASMPDARQKSFARAMTASPDVDLVIGQHAHVVQPITTVNGKWVAYGAGNLIAQSGPAKPRSYDGYLATFTFTEQADGSFKASAAEFAPTFITRHRADSPARVHIISEALKAGRGDATALRSSAARTRDTVMKLGAEGLSEH